MTKGASRRVRPSAVRLRGLGNGHGRMRLGVEEVEEEQQQQHQKMARKKKARSNCMFPSCLLLIVLFQPCLIEAIPVDFHQIFTLERDRTGSRKEKKT